MSSTVGPPKTIPYSRIPHGQALHAIQSEDGSIQFSQSLSQSQSQSQLLTQGGGLRRMNAINPFADVYSSSLSSPVAHVLHPPSSSVSTVSSAPHDHSPSLPLSPAAAVISRRRLLNKDKDKDVNDNDNDQGNGSSYDTTDSDAPDEPLERGLFEGEGDRDMDDTPQLIQLPMHVAGAESAKDLGSDSESTYRTPERMLASAFKKLALSPPRRPHHLQQIGSALQIRTPKDGETDGYYANDDDDLGGTDSDDSPGSSPLAVSAMIRVTSFSAFGSAPIYDAEDAERRVGKLRKERRRQVALTDEFGRLRLLFARNSIATLISKALKRRSSSI